MSWYTCQRCEFLCKQREVMRRHLDKKKKCVIKDTENKLTETELYNMSLEKKNCYTVLSTEVKPNYCIKCDKQFSRKFCYERHLKNNKSERNVSVKTLTLCYYRLNPDRKLALAVSI